MNMLNHLSRCCHDAEVNQFPPAFPSTLSRLQRLFSIQLMVICLGLILGATATLMADKKPKITLPDYSSLVKVQRNFTKTVRFYPGGKIKVQTGFMGNVTIEGWERGEVKVEATITGWGKSPEEAMESVKAIEPHITRSETEMTITTVHAANFTLGSIDYHVVVPRHRSDFMIKSLRGFISIKDVNGWSEVDTQIGYLSLINLSGYLSAKTNEGDILAQLKGNRWDGIQVSAITKKGDIKLYLPTEYSADLTVITLRGDIQVDYPPYLENEEEQNLAVAKKKEGAFISQKIRSGGASLVFQTSVGNAQVNKYDPKLEYITPAGKQDQPKGEDKK